MIKTTQLSQARPRWFLRREFLGIAALIIILLLGGNIAYAFISSHTSHPAPLPPSQHVSATVNPTPAQTPAPPTSNVTSYTSPLNAQDKANWDVLTYTNGGSCAFSKGVYHAKIPQNGAATACNAENTSVTDFSCQVQMTILSGDGGGLIFRSDANKGSFYRLHIGPDGSYDLASQRSTIVASSSPAIMQGVNQVNTIKVIVIGSQISMYVNGELLTTVQDTSATSGRIGLFAVAINSSTDVAFSNIQLAQL
jgi:hypothetical protein